MMTIDEALRNVTSATYTRWIEYRTPSGNWSRKRHQETQDTITPKEARFLAENQHLYGNKRRYLPGMTRTDIPLRHCRVLQDACLCVRKGVYVDLYRDIYRPAS